jgi:hypothetical protein
LAENIYHVYPEFDAQAFRMFAIDKLESLGLHERGYHIAMAIRKYLPRRYENAVQVILDSLTPPNTETEGLGLAVLFYHPHSCFISEYGLDKQYNDGEDPFEISMIQILMSGDFVLKGLDQGFLGRPESRHLFMIHYPCCQY